MEGLIVHGNELRLFGAKKFPILVLLMPGMGYIAVIGTTFNLNSYEAILAEHRIHHLPVPGGCATRYATDAGTCDH